MSQAANAQIEYSIYTFDMPKQGQKGQTKWKKHSTLEDMNKAFKQAEDLLATELYQKVEVKQKFFDKKKNRTVDGTLKVYELEPQKDNTVLYLIIFAIAAGVLAFAGTYFLAQN